MCVSVGLVTLIFDFLTLKLVRESHLRCESFLPSLGTLGLWVLELFATGRTDRHMDGRTDGRTKPVLSALFPTGGGITNGFMR